YTQLNKQYKYAIRNAQNMAIEYGKESEQALKAAEAAGELGQRIKEANETARGSGSKLFDPNSVPFVNNTGGDQEAAPVQDFRFTETAIDEVRAHVDMLTESYEKLSAEEKEGAAGQSLLAEINALNASYDDAVLHSAGLQKAS